MYTIREFNFTDQDYADVVAVHNADWPDEMTTVEDWQYFNSIRNPSYLDQQFVVGRSIDDVRRQEVVATFRIWESQSSYVPGKYKIEFSILPDLGGQDVEELIFQHIREFLTERIPVPTILDTEMREDRTDRVAFWSRHGFEVIMREPESELVVTDYDFSRFEGAFERIASHGIKIFTMAELRAKDPDWLRHYYDLFWFIVNDVPSADKRTPIPIDEWGKRIDSPRLLPEANFFALDGDQYVGVSNLWKDSSGSKNLNVGVTGVLPSHRRKGIATALKLKTIQYAIDHGAVTLKTGNEENNPMYNLNMALGFKPKPAWLKLRKRLTK